MAAQLVKRGSPYIYLVDRDVIILENDISSYDIGGKLSSVGRRKLSSVFRLTGKLSSVGDSVGFKDSDGIETKIVLMAKAKVSKRNKSTRYRKYRDGYWIKSRYLLYRFWYKFLQYAELDANRTVDWSKYNGWGGPTVVLHERFEKWWKQHWKKLFGVRKENDKALFEITRKKARAEAIRVALLVYEYRHLIDPADNRPIFDALNAKYRNLGSIDKYETDKKDGKVIFENGKPRQRAKVDTKYLNHEIKRYLKQAETLLDQVCRGEFG